MSNRKGIQVFLVKSGGEMGGIALLVVVGRERVGVVVAVVVVYSSESQAILLL